MDLTGWVERLVTSVWVAATSPQHLQQVPTLYLTLYTNVPVLLILLLEKLIAKDLLAWRLGMFLHMTNLFLMLVIPIVVINVKSEFIGVYGATWVTLIYAVLFLKMWSYIQVPCHSEAAWLLGTDLHPQVNHWCRCSITILGHKRGYVRHQSIYRQASIIKVKREQKYFQPYLDILLTFVLRNGSHTGQEPVQGPEPGAALHRGD